MIAAKRAYSFEVSFRGVRRASSADKLAAPTAVMTPAEKKAEQLSTYETRASCIVFLPLRYDLDRVKDGLREIYLSRGSIIVRSTDGSGWRKRSTSSIVAPRLRTNTYATSSYLPLLAGKLPNVSTHIPRTVGAAPGASRQAMPDISSKPPPSIDARSKAIMGGNQNRPIQNLRIASYKLEAISNAEEW